MKTSQEFRERATRFRVLAERAAPTDVARGLLALALEYEMHAEAAEAEAVRARRPKLRLVHSCPPATREPRASLGH